MRIGVVHSRFNEEICNALLETARAELVKARAEPGGAGIEAEFVAVAGALEIPLALQWLAQSGRFDALVALGAVIRGDTYHFEVVSNESARGIMDVALECGLPVSNGVLTTEDETDWREHAEGIQAAIREGGLRLAIQRQYDFERTLDEPDYPTEETYGPFPAALATALAAPQEEQP